MAGEWYFIRHGKNANLGIVRDIARRQHERRFGIIEFGCNGLHLRGRKAAGVEHYRQRIAAEGAIGKNIDSDIAPLHLISPQSIPAAIPASAGHIP